MSNNYIKFLEDSLREQMKMTTIILAQLKATREELEIVKLHNEDVGLKLHLMEEEIHARRTDSKKS